jgi:hypothetical protein
LRCRCGAALALFFAAATDGVPFIDADGLRPVPSVHLQGRAACRIRDLGGHAALLSRGAATAFLAIFGALCLADGVLGVFTCSGCR